MFSSVSLTAGVRGEDLVWPLSEIQALRLVRLRNVSRPITAVGGGPGPSAQALAFLVD